VAAAANSISIIMIQAGNQHPRTARRNLPRTGDETLHWKENTPPFNSQIKVRFLAYNMFFHLYLHKMDF